MDKQLLQTIINNIIKPTETVTNDIFQDKPFKTIQIDKHFILHTHSEIV